VVDEQWSWHEPEIDLARSSAGFKSLLAFQAQTFRKNYRVVNKESLRLYQSAPRIAKSPVATA
jgi:hypothetical protein